MKTEQPDIAETLGKLIARDIFAIGRGPEPCARIAFMAGDWRTEERKQGGLCQEALAYEITLSLRKYLPNTHD